MSGCWIYFRYLDPNGYGRLTINGIQRSTHRWTYLTLIGPVTPGLDLDHLCRNRSCCNPLHLEPVTKAENIRRGETGKWQADKTHCPQGHEYSELNTYRYIRKDGTKERQCRTCNYERQTKTVAVCVAIGWSTNQ